MAAAVLGGFALGRVTAPDAARRATTTAPLPAQPPDARAPAALGASPTPRRTAPAARPRPGAAHALDQPPPDAPDAPRAPTPAPPTLPTPSALSHAAFDAAMTAFADRQFARARDAFLDLYDASELAPALYNAAVASAEQWKVTGDPDDAELATALYEQYATARAAIDPDDADAARAAALALQRTVEDATRP